MDRRILLQAALAFLIGVGVVLAEVLVANVLVVDFSRASIPHDITELALHVQSLAMDVLLIWGLASLLGAWLLALLKPRRWALYSACAVAFGVAEALYGVYVLMQNGVPVGYVVLSDVVRIALVPLFLALIYATLRWHKSS